MGALKNTWEAPHAYCSFLHSIQRAHGAHTYQLFPSFLWVGAPHKGVSARVQSRLDPCPQRTNDRPKVAFSLRPLTVVTRVSSNDHAVDGRNTPSMLDIWDRPPRLHTFDRGRPSSTAHDDRRRPLRAVDDLSEKATLTVILAAGNFSTDRG